MKLTLAVRNVTLLVGVVFFGFLVATQASAKTVWYVTDFAKDNNVFTNLNEQFPHTDNGTGVPGSGVGTADAIFLFDPSAVVAAGYAPDYISGSNLVNNGVDFELTSDAGGHDFASFATGGLTIPINLNQVQIVYALLSAYNGQTISATFTGADGTTQTFDDIYVPDFNGGSINDISATVNDQTVFQVADVGAGGSGNSMTGAFNNYGLTEVRFPLSPGLAGQELTSVTFTANGYEGLLLAVTAVSGVPAPTVALTSPPDQITVVAGETVPLTASVTDPGGVLASVQFLVNGQVIATSATAPFTTTETLSSAGSYVLAVVSTDALGRTSTNSVTVTAIAADANKPPPATDFLTPLDGLTLLADSMVTLTASADAGSVGLERVSFYADGALLAAYDGNGNLVATGAAGPGGVGIPHPLDSAATGVTQVFQTPYQMPGENKLVNLIVVALDKLGRSTVSSAAAVTASVTSDQPPSVALTGLSNGARVAVGSTTAVGISASDPDTGNVMGVGTGGATRKDAGGNAVLAKLEGFINKALTSISTAPFSLSFTPVTAGKYVLHAVATDGSGLSKVSDPVVVEADAPTTGGETPTVTIAASGSGTVVEGEGKAKVVVSRAGGDTSAGLVVRYKVKGSAVAGEDYKRLAGEVTIPAGATQAKVKVKPIDNVTADGTRSVKIKLLPSVDGSYTLGSPAGAKVKIEDDDSD